ncbi:MAG: arginase family protein [Lachnospiraceae bacterium]|nr:arginase family protein [Lachnospiraceae bacterium]
MVSGLQKKTVSIIGSQMDMGAVRKGVDMGPLAIRHAGLIRMIRDIGYQVKDCGDILPMVATSEGNPRMRYEKEINEANERLFHRVLEIHEDQEFPVILGGDHSIAAGSVSAAAQHFGKIGLLWIDAHGDFNDDRITPTGNIHGMPLSAVCGCGPDSLVSFTEARVDPHNVAVIGAREMDPEEIKN